MLGRSIRIDLSKNGTALRLAQPPPSLLILNGC
jgi:hypothetical protein